MELEVQTTSQFYRIQKYYLTLGDTLYFVKIQTYRQQIFGVNFLKYFKNH